MIEITNKQRSPVQVLVRSKKKLRAFTTLIIPGRGAGKNVVVIADEDATDYIGKIEDIGLISTRRIKN